MKVTLTALSLGLGMMLQTGCMTVTGNCINATYGGNVDNNTGGNSSASDTGCRVTTNIYYIVIGRPTAFATLKNSMGEVVGSAALAESKDSVVIATEVHGLARGKYAMHVHSAGKCDAPDFLSAGPYINPTKNSKDRRASDLPNFRVNANGRGDVSFTLDGATLDDGPNGILGPNGTAIIIQEKPDKTDKTANTSRRIACGVVKRTDTDETTTPTVSLQN